MIYMGLSYTVFKSLLTYSRMKPLLTNHHLQSYCLLHHIFQIYHPLYSEDARNHTIECPQQQFYDYSARRTIKLSIQEYYDAYACYLKLYAYMNDSASTLVSPPELQIFVHHCIQVKELYQATRYDCNNNDFKYNFLPYIIVQTLQLEYSHLPSDYRLFDRYSDHFCDCSSDQPYDQLQSS